jgi:hypothetical protein
VREVVLVEGEASLQVRLDHSARLDDGGVDSGVDGLQLGLDVSRQLGLLLKLINKIRMSNPS